MHAGTGKAIKESWNLWIFSIREQFLELRDKLSLVYNMASSGLKKMFFYTIFETPDGVWENIVSFNIWTLMLF